MKESGDPRNALYFLGVVALFVAAGYVVYRILENRRREAMKSMANELGLEYVSRDASIAARYRFETLHQGLDRNQYAYNILRGMYKGHSVQIFDYRYATDESRRSD